MSDEEVVRLKRKYGLSDDGSVRLFVTRHSDIEAYFCQIAHLQSALGVAKADAEVMVKTAINESQNEFAMCFRTKRDAVKQALYKADPDACPSPIDLLPGAQLPFEKAVGKLLLKKLGPKLQQMGRNPAALLVVSEALSDSEFRKCIQGSGSSQTEVSA